MLIVGINVCCGTNGPWLRACRGTSGSAPSRVVSSLEVALSGRYARPSRT
jgi:hypothetical protein